MSKCLAEALTAACTKEALVDKVDKVLYGAIATGKDGRRLVGVPGSCWQTVICEVAAGMPKLGWSLLSPSLIQKDKFQVERQERTNQKVARACG